MYTQSLKVENFHEPFEVSAYKDELNEDSLKVSTHERGMHRRYFPSAICLPELSSPSWSPSVNSNYCATPISPLYVYPNSCIDDGVQLPPASIQELKTHYEFSFSDENDSPVLEDSLTILSSVNASPSMSESFSPLPESDSCQEPDIKTRLISNSDAKTISCPIM